MASSRCPPEPKTERKSRTAEDRERLSPACRLGLPEVHQIETGPAPATMSNAATAVDRFRTEIRDLDALVCVSDPVAFGALMALQTLGLRVPQDLAVTGFGDFEVSRICQPGITTLDVGAEYIGTVTGDLATQILLGEDGHVTPRIHTITPKLLVRASA